MIYATLDALRSDLGKSQPLQDPVYVEKMLHPVPESETVDRSAFIIDAVRGKQVLSIGASGPLHLAMLAVAKVVVGWDKVGGVGIVEIDLDRVSVGLPALAWTPDVIVCGEILEHLSNPGWLLQRLKDRYPSIGVIITVPNAFSQVCLSHMKTGTENVNRDHVSWYSYTVLKTLLGRYGYVIRDHKWYGGPPYLAEGLIVVTE